MKNTLQRYGEFLYYQTFAKKNQKFFNSSLMSWV
jgi:hypothetical protein